MVLIQEWVFWSHKSQVDTVFKLLIICRYLLIHNVEKYTGFLTGSSDTRNTNDLKEKLHLGL